MGDPEHHLTRWRDAGLLDDDAVARIRAFEDGSPDGASDRPGLQEALVYVGIAVVGVGVVVLAATRWDHLSGTARLGLTGLSAVLALACGFVLRARWEPGLRRGGSLAYLVAQAAVTLAAGLAADESDAAGRNILLTIGVVAPAAGAVIWRLSPGL
jgi:uncharacterized membrane protein